MSKLEITSEDFLEWRANPVTQVVFSLLRSEIQAAKDRWAQGQCFAESGAFQSMILQAQTLGNIEAAERLIALEFSQLEIEDES